MFMKTDSILSFYEPLAEHYHLIFDDWGSAIERQAKVLNPLLASGISGSSLKILDCACGIGTQAIGFAEHGHRVTASDLSRAEINRAERESERRNLDISFHVSDMTSLQEIAECDFDAVVAMDNALPHLDVDQLDQASHAIASKLKPDGLFLASIRDYDEVMPQKPTMQSPVFYGEPNNRRIVHQVWDWIDDRRYIVHLYITSQSDRHSKTQHFTSEYHCLLRHELSTVLKSSGFGEVRWLMPAESRFYQPIVLARLAG